MRKRVVSTVVSLSLLLSATHVLAAPLIVDGKKVNNDVVIKDGIQYIPLTKTIKDLNQGMQVKSEYNSILGYKQPLVIKKDGEVNPIINGRVIDGAVYIPVETLGKIINSNVNYNSNNNTTTLVTNSVKNQQWVQEKAMAETMRADVVNAQELLLKYEKTGDKDAFSKLKVLADRLELDETDYEALPNTAINNVRLLSHTIRLEMCLTAQNMLLSRLSSDFAKVKGQYDDSKYKYDIIKHKKEANDSIRILNRILEVNWKIDPVPELK